MFEFHNHAAGKRVMAMLLVLAMMFAMLGDYVPTWFAAVAEEVNEEGSGHSESSGSEDGSSGEHESSHEDSGSSGERESSHEDSGSSGERESSHEDNSSSGEHESSHEDSGLSEERESSHQDSDSSETRESASPEETVVWGEVSGDGFACSEDEHDDAVSGDGEVTSDNDSSDNIESELPEVTVIWGEASGDEHAGSENEQNDVFAENVEVTSEDESTSGDSGVSEVNEDRAADDSIPVVVWGASGDGDAAGEMETVTEPSGKPAPAEGGTEDSAPVEAAVKEVEVLIGETDPAEAEVEPAEVGADDSAPVEAAVKEVEALIGETGPVYVEAADPGDGAESGNPGAVLTLAAAPSPAVENSEPVEDEVLESEPLFTTQAYTAPVMLAATGAEEEKVCVLQQKIDDAMASVTGTLTGRLQVILNRNTNYEGEVTISAGDRTVADDFALELTAEDAGDDGMKGEGYTTIAGQLTIRGVKVVMNSVSMAAGQGINVTGKGALQYNGTQNAANVLNVTVGGESSAEIITSDTNDTITVTAQDGAKSVSINAGDGMNTVNGTVGSGDFSFVSGNASDTVNLDLEGSGLGAVYVDSGENIDDLNVTVNGQAKDPVTWEEEKDEQGNVISRKLVGGMVISSGAGDDNVNVDVRANAGDITVDTGLGSDAVYVFKGDHRTVESIDYTRVYNPTEEINENATSVVTLINSDPDAVDRLTVDVDASDAIGGIALQGGQGTSVHLRGTLAKADAPISGDAARLTLTGEKGNGLFITTQQGEGAPTYNFTDALKNKRTVYIYGDGNDPSKTTGDLTYGGATDDFTNYVFKTPVNGLNSITVTGSDHPLLLSNVVLDAQETKDVVKIEDNGIKDTEETIKINNLSAGNLNVLVKGKNIEIGDIAAQNVRAESIQGISTLYEALAELSSSNFDMGADTAFAGTGVEQMLADMVSLSDSASIVVRGNVTAMNDVALLARVKQYGDIFALMPGSLNVVNIKLASAGVHIAETAALTAQQGTVSAEAKIQTVTGDKISYDEDGVGTQSQSGPPLSVTWVTDDASVTVDKNARLQAAEDVLLNSRTDIRVINNSRSGGFSSPMALAFTWISSTVNTAAHGSLEAGRLVSVTATGDISDDTAARRGDAATGASGGFVAVNVVNQEVNALIGEGAQVKAGGDVAVYSTNLVDAQTLVASSGPKEASSGAAATAFLRMFNTVLEPIKEEVRAFFKDDFYTQKVEKLLKRIAAGDYRVNVVDLSADNAAKGSASVSVKMRKDDEGGEGEDHLWAVVDAQPKAGCEVQKVQYRYLEKGYDQYTYRTVEQDEKGRYAFVIDHDDIEVIVTYSGEPSGGADPQPQPAADDDFEDVFDIAQLFDDAADGVGGSADDDDEFQMDPDVTVHNSHPLSIDNTAAGGKLVTWLTNDEDGNLDTIYGGQKVRFVPNPDEGMAPDTLTVIYTEEGPDGQNIVRKVAVAADSQGRWYFTVPEALANGAEISVTAAFKKAAGRKEASAHNQAAGAVAVGVVINEGSAVIEPGAVVEAGGTVDMIGTTRTSMNNQADGTAITEDSGSASGENKPQQTELTKYSIPGADYAVKAESTLPGALSCTLESSEGASSSHPVITFKPDNDDWTSVKVALSYYTKFNANPKTGSLWTSEVTLNKSDLVPNEDGSYSCQPDLGEYAVVSGTTMEIDLVFLDAGGQIMTADGQGAREYLVRNPIRVSNNALTQKDSEGKQQITEIGKVNYVRVEGSKYYIKLAPEDGYRVDALGQRVGDIYFSNKDALYASWRGTDGTLQKASLKHTGTDATGEWFFDVGDGNISLPEGALVTIAATFVEDNRDIEVPEDVQEKIRDQGSVEFSKSAAKAGDEVTFTLTGKQGWYGSSVTVSWVDLNGGPANEQKSETLTPDAYGKVTFTMPKMADSSTLQVTPAFSQRIVNLNVTGSTGAPDTSDKSLALSDTSGMGYAGEIITVSPSADLTKDGYKVTDIKVQFNDDTQQIIPDTNDTFTISDIAESSGNLYISATLALKEIEVNPHTDATGLGSIEPVSRRADKGDKVMVSIVPKAGYRIRKGTLAAEIITKNGTEQIVLDYEGPNSYSFTMPGGDEIDATTVVNLSGEFEPGSDGVSLSLGVGVAVGVSSGKNDIEIRGGEVTGGTGISMLGISADNKAVTEAKAGFNRGDTGLAGAFAVQVASTETTEAIRKDDNGFITVKDGSISMTAKGTNAFKVTGDARGKTGAEASGTGVGAGIAFAVNGVSTTAIIEDGVKLDRAGDAAPASRLTDVILTAGHKTRDQVTGRAGAIGGSAFVPVAVADIFSSNAAAKLGALDLSVRQAAAQAKAEAERTDEDKLYLQNILPVAGMVKLKAASDSARVQYNHDIAADASARGGDTALGGAFIVSWIGSDANALLNQSVSAPLDVSVNTSSGDAVRAVATAAVSGGDKGKKNSADRQADKLMGCAGKVAGKYGGMDGAMLQNDAKGRQKAETAEGSVAGAGAFVLNIQNNKARAEIPDGVDVTTQGKLTVKSANRTEAFVRANASSTKSDTGVGVGVALNIVTMENIARIGNGSVTAAELELAAVIAKEPTIIRNMTVAENASNFETQLNTRFNETIKALIGEEDYEKLEPLIGPESTFFTKMLNKLVTDLNLSQLLNIAADGSAASFTHLGEVIYERLTEFPEAVAKPLLTVLQEAGAMVSGWDEARYQRFLDDLSDSVSTQLAGSAVEILKKTVMNSVDSLLGSSIDMVTDKVSGKGWNGDKLKEQLGAAMMEALKEFTDTLIQDMVKSLNSEFPIVTENNVELVKKLKDTTLTELRKEFLPYVTKSFREQVYDYEPLLVKIEQNGFADFLEDELRGALKEAAVAATNEALEKLVGKLDVRFEREAVEDRHVITTQAISGAGAKTDTIAGSVAIAVTNLTTTAELAGGGDAVNVTGDMILNAEELRRIRTHATAAVDAKGEPDNNEGAGNTEKHETGGGSAGQTTVYQGNITVTTGVGGKASFDAEASEDNPVVWLDVSRGYNLKEGATFARSYTDSTGAEIVDTVTVRREGDDFFIVPFENIDIKDVKADDLKDLAIGIDIEFEKSISDIKAPEVKVDGQGPMPGDGAVTVTAENGEMQGDLLMVEYGSEVRVAIDPDKTEGLKIQEISFSYLTIEEGEIVSKTGTLSDGQVVKKTSNADGTVYVFSMPEYEIYELIVTFEPGQEERASESEATDGAGRSVGVGAAFALTYGNSDVASRIGVRGAGVTAGTLAVTASSEHQEENYSTAGTDPFAGVDQGEGNEGKGIGVDASLAINMLDNAIEASVAEGTPVTTTAVDEGDAESDVTPGALIVHASEGGGNETKASAFATGSSTAVGASVAVNVSISDIQAKLGGGAKASGRAVVRSESQSEDRTWSFASALGADVQRALNKVADGAKAAAETANSLSTGEYFDEKAGDEQDKKNATDTSRRITDRLNEKKAAGGDDASENLPVSANVLRSMGAVIENGEEANQAGQQAQDLVNDAGGQNVQAQENPNQKKKLQVAAAVGVTVALHNAAVNVGGAINAGKAVELTADNAGNFNTRSTAAAMTTEEGPGKTIAAAVGVSVNSNGATVDVKGDITAGEDLTVASTLTQNMTGDYPGRLAVQALSGSVSGKGAEYSIAGAVSALVSHAVSSAKVDGAKKMKGKAVRVTATDKSKLAVRAGGVNVSRGANIGMGISAATIWSGDTVEAIIGDGATVDSDDAFELAARKLAVTMDDYVFPLSWADLITDSSALNDDERQNVYAGLIDIHKKPGEVSYDVDVHMDTYALMKIPDMLNFLSATNYYTEAVAGSLVMGEAGQSPNKLNGAGSISIVRAANTVNAALGNNVSIKKDSGWTLDALVESAAETNARILGGAVSGGPAQKSAGITLTFLYDEDAASTDIGSDVVIEGGKVALKSSADTAVQTFNAAAGVNTSEQGGQTLGGAVNVLVLRNSAKTNAGAGLTANSGSSIDVTAGANMDLKLVSAGISGARRGTAAGGTLAYIDDGADSEVNIGDRHNFNTVGKITISAVTKDRLISVLASASAAPSAEGKAYAAAINVMNSSAKGNVTLGSDSIIKSRLANGIDILGIAGSTAVNITVAAAGSGGRAIGASVNANFYNRESTVNIGDGKADYDIEAANDILISAAGDDTTVMVGVAAAGSTDGMAIGGNLPIVSSKNTVSTKLARTTVNTTAGEAAIASHLRDRTYAIAGSIALANGGSAAGATALMAFKKNTVTTDLGESSVTVAGSSGELASRVAGNPTFKGLYVGATDDNTVFVGAAGMALSSEKGITGNLVTLSSANTVLADASRAALTAVQTPPPDPDMTNDEATGGDVTVVARNDNYQTLFAGGLNFGLSMGIGASLAVLVSENDVRVKAHDIDSFGNVSVTAMNDEHLLGLNVNAGGSGKTAVELGASVLSIRSRVNAEVASAITARHGGFDLKANNTTDLIDLAVALAGAGEVAASPVFVAAVFGGEANAKLNAGTVSATEGVNVAADSTKTIDQYTVGASFAGETALSGAVSVVSVKDQTNALVAQDTDITANTLDVTAYSDYTLNGASAAVSGGKFAGAVNGMLNIVKASTLAEMEGKATLSGAANVNARSVRDIVNVEATVGAGQTGVGFAVMATIAGDRLDDDAVDMLTYGSAESKDDGKTFDVDAMVKSLKDMGVDTSSLEEQKDEEGKVTQTSLADDLTGNGQRMSTTQVGDGDHFDASSGYVSDDLYNGGDGADAQFEESADLQQARTVGGSACTEDPTDAVNARIGANAVLSAYGVTVQAEQQTLADMYGATVGAGAATGVGISFAAAILRSNVFATSLGAIDAHEKDVLVNAVSHTGDITPEAGSEEEQRMNSVKESLGDALNITKRSIRTVGLAVGGAGTAAMAVTAGMVRLDNVTNATMGGALTNAAKVTVNADSKYGNVLAATLAAAGSGEMAVSGSIAATGMHGTTRAMLDSTADISGENMDLYVTTNSWMKGNTAAAAVAASGGGSVAAGLSVAVNELTQDTLIERGARIRDTDGDGLVTVEGSSETEANTYLFSMDVGAAAIGLSAAYSNVKPTQTTTVGVEGEGTTSVEGVFNLTILNKAVSSANSNLLSASAGLGSILGSAMLAFNDTRATAKAGSVSGQFTSLGVESQMKADGNSKAALISGGAGALGVSVNYVDVNSENTAELDMDEFTADVKYVVVKINDDKNTYTTTANAETLAGSAAGVNLGVNTAIARNRARNNGVIHGKNDLKAHVSLKAWGNGSASAKLSGLSIGGLDVAASVVSAVNEATNKVTMKLDGTLDTDGIDILSDLGGSTAATLESGSGSLIGIDVNVASAYGRATSQIDVDVAKVAATKMDEISISNTGADDVNTTIDNQSFSGINVATMVGVAHSQDVYDTKVKLGGEINAGEIALNTRYNTNTQSAVTPSSMGVKIGGATLDINYATATNTTNAATELSLANATVKTDKNVNVYTRGNAGVTGWIKPALFELDATVGVGANQAKADLAATQSATLRMEDSAITAGSDVNVKSVAEKADALATISTSGSGKEGKDRLKLSLVSAEINKAIASERMNSAASILGGGSANNSLASKGLSVFSGSAEDAQTTSTARTDGGEDVTFVSVGNLDGHASSGENFNVTAQGFSADIDGDVSFLARTNVYSEGVGYAPGNFALYSKSKSNIDAGVGAEDGKQTAKATVGEDVSLAANKVVVHALNTGYSEAAMKRSSEKAMIRVDDATQPTHNWYDTAVVIGDGAVLTSRDAMDVLSKTDANAKSNFESSGMSLLVNAGTMQGENNVDDTNRLSVGKGASLKSGGDMSIQVDSTAKSDARTKFNASFGIYGGQEVYATNNVNRTLNLLIDDGASIRSDKSMMISSIVGKGDSMETHADQDVFEEIDYAKAHGELSATTDNTIEIRGGVNIGAGGDLVIKAQSSGTTVDGNNGYYTRGNVDSGDDYNFIDAPDASAKSYLGFDTTININADSGDRTCITSDDGSVLVLANNEGLHSETKAEVLGDGFAGGIEADTYVKAELNNLIKVNKTTFNGKTGTSLRANFGEDYIAFIHTWTRARLISSTSGSEETDSTLDGTQTAYIYTDDKQSVEGGDNFTHEAKNVFHHSYEFVTDGSPAVIDYEEGYDNIRVKQHCDFCDSFEDDDNDSTNDRSRKSRKDGGASVYSDASGSGFGKILVPLKDIRKKTVESNHAVKALDEAYDILSAEDIFVLALETLLKRDVTLDGNSIDKYRLWKNIHDGLEVYLLPNATRLYTLPGHRLQYVADVLHGDVLGNGEHHNVDVITALTAGAFSNPVIPIGSAGKLDFTTGAFTLPENADFDLFLREVSGAWLIEKLADGFIRRLDADQTAIDACVIEGGELPQGVIVEGLTEDGELVTGSENTGDLAIWKLYWLGDTPETAKTPDQTLIFLLVKEKTDEVDAFRTSVNRIAAGEAPVDVSLYLFRDGESDQQHQEKYNCMFFDTPAGEKSTVKIAIGVPEEGSATSGALDITLRSFALDGMDLPAFAINDHFYVLSKVTDGRASLFGGAYQITFDGATFDSDYMRIEGIIDGDLKIIFKQGQNIWPEWNRSDSAVDIQGEHYVYIDNVWHKANEAIPIRANTVAT